MNRIVAITRGIAIVALLLSVLGIAFRLQEILHRPKKRDLSRPRGNVGQSLLYAFTLGMAPWEKESTRIHWVAYVRGILFHVGVFVALGVFLVSPWLAAIPLVLSGLALLVTAVGAVAGFTGIWMRLAEENLRALSLPDDYFSVFLTSLFTALAFAVLLWPVALPAFYLAAAAMLVYIPFSKIRHCVYFFYSKFFFGQSFGHRGVIGHPASEYSE
jgi:hypothetical protein